MNNTHGRSHFNVNLEPIAVDRVDLNFSVYLNDYGYIWIMFMYNGFDCTLDGNSIDYEFQVRRPRYRRRPCRK